MHGNSMIAFFLVVIYCAIPYFTVLPLSQVHRDGRGDDILWVFG